MKVINEVKEAHIDNSDQAQICKGGFDFFRQASRCHQIFAMSPDLNAPALAAG